MLKLVSKTLFSVSLFALCSVANASLITNGSFEQLTFADHSSSYGSVFNTNLQAFANKRRGWDVFDSLPGWETTLGNGIELQKNIVTSSQDGQYHLELDSHPRGASNTLMTQTVDSLVIGEEYLLEFYYKARTNSSNDNGINVYWYDSVMDFDFNIDTSFVSDSTRQLTPNWVLQSVMLTAQDTSMDLSFGAFGRANSLGGLVDNVSLVHVAKVPEPSMAALFLSGLGLLVFRQRKIRK